MNIRGFLEQLWDPSSPIALFILVALLMSLALWRFVKYLLKRLE